MAICSRRRLFLSDRNANMSDEIRTLGITGASELLKKGELSSRELTDAYLQEIDSRNPALNAFLDVWHDDARRQANDADERRTRGESLGVLDGIPIAIKDNMLVQGKRCTAGSKILENYLAVNHATVIKKLNGTGAVYLGKTNMDEFAMGSSTENSAFGPVRHPRDPDRVPGGSSGGSAVAVAADLCAAALGSDTGGSIRQPAAFCGIVGFKPTYGRISRSGLIAMASSFDQIGPMTKSVEDAATLFSVMYGKDSLDQTTANAAPFVPVWRSDLTGVKVGLPAQAWGEGIDKDVRSSVESAVKTLSDLGADIVNVDLPYSGEALAVYYVVMPCEVSANLSRFDGIRYGRREPASTLLETYLHSRGEGIGPEPRRRILLGTYALSHGYYDAYYRKAKKVQTLIQNAYASALERVDVLVTPTAPTKAFRIGEKVNDPLSMYLEDLFTVGANVAGLPAISVPCGASEGLPIGMHLIGRAFDEASLLAVARAYEEARGVA